MDVREWLGEDNQLGIDIWEKKYRHDNESFDGWLDRVSGGDPEVRQLIAEKKFLFGGRVLANRNVKGSGNFFNCFSAGFVPDDYAGIMDMLKEVGITFKHQGGQGISLTKLRPKDTPIGTEHQSDGIVPFMEMFNSVTQGTSQGGARKGALMISLDVNHKEAEQFITLKTDLDAITKANLSLEIDDEFMKAVEKFYDDGERVVLHKKYDYNSHAVEYDIVPIDLYKLMMKVVWDYGEPGCLFVDRLRNYNFLEYDDNYRIATTNPCGEQPLMERTSCCLGSINLYEFVKDKFTENAYFDWNGFAEAIRIAGNALDDIINENVPRLPKEMVQYAVNATNWRNMGLGVFNYAHALMALRLKYGSKEALCFTDGLFEMMMTNAIKYNIERAETKGDYPMFNRDLIEKSEIFRSHNTFVGNQAEWGFRNCTLLSIAPNGSIGTMVGGSGGTEPEFALSYTRRTDNLNEEYKIDSKIVQDYRKITGNKGTLPDYFITSAEIPWKERIDTQAIIQKHIDTAISSTVNLPKETSLDEIEQLYLYAWQQGLKGVTVFRDGCKRAGILTTQKEETTPTKTTELNRGTILSVSDDLLGAKRKLQTGCGSLHLETYFDEITGEPMETFINVGSSGGCERNLQLISRLMSLALRAGVPIEAIIDQCKSIKPCPAYTLRTQKKGDTSKGSSCPSAIGFALEELYSKIQERCFADFDNDEEYTADYKCESYSTSDISESTIPTEKCPECGEPLPHEGGCVTCHSCGYSPCG